MKYLRLFCFLALAAALHGQRGTVDVKGSLGLSSFVDDGADNHLQTGMSARMYITRRLSFEPEFQYLYQSGAHDDIVLVPNVAWDFRTGRIVPYVSGGVGWMRSRFKNLRPAFTNNEIFGQVGGGVKIYVNNSWFIAPEARIGWEPHVRLSVGIGYTFRR